MSYSHISLKVFYIFFSVWFELWPSCKAVSLLRALQGDEIRLSKKSFVGFNMGRDEEKAPWERDCVEDNYFPKQNFEFSNGFNPTTSFFQ